MKRGFSLATKLLLAFALLAGLFPATAGSQPPDKVRVLIGFLAEPDEDDEDMINSLDGEVEHSYNLVPVIAATVPAHRIAKLEEDPEVAYIEPDILVDAVQDTLPWGVDRIDADLAWPTSKGLGAQVAVVDTGIDLNHPDLAVNIAGDVNFVNPARTGNDDNGHGTHVAGTVAADDNGTGVVGVAPDASLYAVKVLNRRGSGWLSDVIAGIDWAVRGPDGVLGNADDAEVINLSLGCACPSLSLQMAVDNAYAQGTLVVGAAGNDPDEPVIYPAAFTSVIAVSATTIGDGLAGFSSIGPEVELAAPGQSITSTYAGGSYAVLSGTSMAAPHVSGAAALVFALGGQTNVGVRQVLQTTAENIGLDPVEQGYGLVDAQAAVGAPPPPPPTLVSIAVAPTTASIVEGSTQQFTATGSFSDGSTADLTTSATWASSNTPVATINASGLATGITAGTADITATQDAVVSNIATLTVTAPPPPPTLVSIAVAPTTASIVEGSTQQFTATGSFSDGSTADLTTSATWASSNTPVATINASGLATGVTAGTANITATQDAVVSNSATLTVTTAPTANVDITKVRARDVRKGTYNIQARIENLGAAPASITVRCVIYDAAGTTVQDNTLLDKAVTIAVGDEVNVRWTEPSPLGQGSYLAVVTVVEDPTAQGSAPFSVVSGGGDSDSD